MKKVLLVLVLCLGLVLTACGGKTENTESNNSKAESSAVNAEESSAVSEESNEAVSNESVESPAVSDEESSEVVSAESEESSVAIESESSEAVSAESEESSETSEEESSEAVSAESEENSVSDTYPFAEQSLIDFVESAEGVVAIAHFGLCDGDFTMVSQYLESIGATEQYPFLSMIDENSFFSTEGTELYAVVLLQENSTLDVETVSYDYESGSFVVENALYSDGSIKPILLRGNYSDMFSDLRVRVSTQFEVSTEYSPALSLENGRLLIPDGVYGVYDFTPYELFGIYSYPWAGEWYGEYYLDASEETFALLLDMGDGGDFTYSVGYVASEIIETVIGTWEEADGVITFTGASDSAPDTEITMVFEWRMEDHSLVLTHIDGSSFLYGEEYASFVFRSNYGLG